MHIDEGKDQALQVLHQVEKHRESLWVFRLLHLAVGADLGGLEGHFLGAHPHHQFLLANFVRLGPLSILAAENAAIKHDALHLVDDRLRYEGCVDDGEPCLRMS